jgi:TPR repeat protein
MKMDISIYIRVLILCISLSGCQSLDTSRLSLINNSIPDLFKSKEKESKSDKLTSAKALHNKALDSIENGDCKTATEILKHIISTTPTTGAYNNLGVIWERGCPEAGVAPNKQKAFEYYLLAAENGYLQAMGNLINYYFYGLAGETSRVKAEYWAERNAAKGGERGRVFLESLKRVKSDATAEELREANKLINEAQLDGLSGDCKGAWEKSKKAYSLNGDKYLYNNFGITYLNGCPEAGIAINEKKGFEYIQEAATEGLISAQQTLGRLYWEGKGVEPSRDNAQYWHEKSAQGGSTLSRQWLSEMKHLSPTVTFEKLKKSKELISYGIEQSTKGNCGNAFESWKKANSLTSDPVAISNIGTIHLSGCEDINLEQNPYMAAVFFKDAASKDNTIAMRNLGMMYRYGIGVNKSLSKSKLWYSNAAQQGDQHSKEVLDQISTEDINVFNENQNYRQKEKLNKPFMNEDTKRFLLKAGSTSLDVLVGTAKFMGSLLEVAVQGYAIGLAASENTQTYHYYHTTYCDRYNCITY